MPLDESSVLEPKDPSLKHHDHWPVFVLKDAYVVSQKTDDAISLLAANKDNPAKITGRLDTVEDEYLHLVKDSDYTSRTILLSNVTVYSFAEYHDGSYGFWAGGQAGWFELEETLPEYDSILVEMNVAASMLYYIADKARRSRKTEFTHSEYDKHIRRLFKDFCAIGKHPVRFSDVEDVQEGFDEHRGFLISSMFEGLEGIDWQEAPMMKYYQTKFPDDVDRIKARVFGVTTSPALIKDNDEKLQSQSSRMFETVPRRKRGRPPKSTQSVQVKKPMTRKDVTSAISDEDDEGGSILPRKRKSILQPSGSKYSRKARKATGKPLSFPNISEPSTSDKDDDTQEEQRPQAEESQFMTIKRGHELQALANSGLEKRRSSSSPPPPDFLPRKFVELKMIDYELPSMQSQGPGDLWTCPFEGCYVRIHKASTAQGRMSIHEHLEAHKSSAYDRVSLALNESRPYLPVNNLIRKLQAIAPDYGEDDIEAPGRQFVAPIRRKY